MYVGYVKRKEKEDREEWNHGRQIKSTENSKKAAAAAVTESGDHQGRSWFITFQTILVLSRKGEGRKSVEKERERETLFDMNYGPEKTVFSWANPNRIPISVPIIVISLFAPQQGLSPTGSL